MPRFKATNSVTGEEVYFEWNNPKPPTPADVNRISDEQRQSRITAKQKVADNSKQSFLEKLMTSDASGYAMKAADTLGLNQPWHPIDSAKEMGRGIRGVIENAGPAETVANSPYATHEAHPILANTVRAAKGALGLVGPPLEAASLALPGLGAYKATAGIIPKVLGVGRAIAPTLAAVGTGNIASKTASQMVPDDWSPEAKEATSLAAGLGAGMAAGYGVHRFVGPRAAPNSPPAEADPMTGDLLAPQRPTVQEPQGEWTGVRSSYAAPGMRARALLPEATEPFGPDKAIPEAPTPIVTKPPDETQVRSISDPRVSPEQRGIHVMPPAQDLVSQARPAEDISPSSVPTVRLPTMPLPEPARPGQPLPLQGVRRSTAVQPAQPILPEPPPIPSPPKPGDVVATPAAQPPAAPLAAPKGDISEADFAALMKDKLGVELPPAQAPVPVPPQAPPAAVPPQPPPAPPMVAPTPQPQVQSPLDMAKAAMAKARPLQPPVAAAPPPAQQAPPMPAPQQTPPPAAPPQAPQVTAPEPPPAQATPQVQAPGDMVKAAMAKAKAPKAPAPEETPVLSPVQQQQIQAWNKVLDFVKTRSNATVEQIQRSTGVPGDMASLILKRMREQGLIKVLGGKINYNKMAGEETSSGLELKPGETREPEQDAPPGTLQEKASPERQSRMDNLQQMIETADNPEEQKVYKDHLAIEKAKARVESKGTPEQKSQIKQIDDIYKRIQELEDKEETDKLSEGDQQELIKHYKEVNKLENQIKVFLKGEKGTQMPAESEEGLKRGWFARKKFIDEHPAAAKPRDISAIRAEFRSQNQVLRESKIPAARQIGVRTPEIQDLSDKFVGTYERKAADFLKGLNGKELKQVGRILDSEGGPEAARGFDPKVVKAALDVRDMMDEIWTTHLKGQKVGRVSNYLPHIEAELNKSTGMSGVFADLWDYHTRPWKQLFDVMKKKPIEDSPAAGEDIYGQKGVGRADSPFAKHRSEAMDNIEFNVKKVLPVYIESIAKFIYAKPWLEEAAKLLADIPENAPNTREYAKNYLRYFARYGEYPTIQSAWDAVTGPLMKMTARSILFMDTRLFTLHAARLATNIYQGVPTKYMAYGAAKLGANPMKSFTEMGRLGMLPGWQRPWFFQRPMAKLDNIGNALSVFDMVPDAIAYHGLKKMYMDQGFSDVESSRMAVGKTKELSLRVDPSRAIKLFTRDLGPFKPFLQFKHTMMKIAEQYATMPINALRRRDYAQVIRFLVGAGSMLAVAEKLKISTWHFSLSNLLPNHAAAYDRLKRIAGEVYRGDIEEAMIDAGLLVTPGGSQAKHVYESGKPTFVED